MTMFLVKVYGHTRLSSLHKPKSIRPRNKEWGRHVSYASETDVDKKKKAANEQDKGTSAFDGMHSFFDGMNFLGKKKAHSFQATSITSYPSFLSSN